MKERHEIYCHWNVSIYIFIKYLHLYNYEQFKLVHDHIGRVFFFIEKEKISLS